MLGLGLAAAGAGGTLWALSSRELRTADGATDETIYADALSSARNFRAGAAVSFVIGGALLVGTVLRYVLVDRAHRRPVAGVTPLPGGLGLGWRGSF